jgi:hypothetical protein
MPDEGRIARRLKMVWEDNAGEGGGTTLTIRITDPSGKHNVVGAAGDLYPPREAGRSQGPCEEGGGRYV